MSLHNFDDFIKNTVVISNEFDDIEEQNLFEKIEEISRIIVPFVGIAHIDCNHGCCVTILGGSMHAFYQLIISVEKTTLVPITYHDNIFKSFLDGY